MSFLRRDENGEIVRYTEAVIDCSNDEVLTEQNHKTQVDVNYIVSSRGVDRIAETTKLADLTFDANPYNDFQEMMEMVAKGKSAFASLPAQVRDEFKNDPARYLDYIRNPENHDEMVKRGWAEPKPAAPAPVEVIITNPEPTPEPDPAT